MKPIKNVGNFGAVILPSKPVKVEKVNGERIVGGKRPYFDSYPGIPYGVETPQGWRAYSILEREALFLKEERRKKRLTKGTAGKAKPVKQGRIPMESSPDVISDLQTVKRGGKWVQVGADNLTAHIEAQ